MGMTTDLTMMILMRRECIVMAITMMYGDAMMTILMDHLLLNNLKQV